MGCIVKEKEKGKKKIHGILRLGIGKVRHQGPH